MKQVEKSLLPNKIKSEQYHTEVIEQEEKTIINIYNTNELKLIKYFFNNIVQVSKKTELNKLFRKCYKTT